MISKRVARLFSCLTTYLFCILTMAAASTYAAVGFTAYGPSPKSGYSCSNPTHHHRHYRNHRKVRHGCCNGDSPSISVYYFIPAYPCGVWGPNASCPGEDWASSSSGYMPSDNDNDGNNVVYWAPANDHYYNYDGDYDPDLSTGDDDQIVHPDMNSQY